MTETKKKNIYPPMILVMIGGFLIFSLWAAFQATGLGIKVTDSDYYSKGLKYTSTQVEKRAAEALGWNLQTQINGLDLEFHLTNREGEGVDRAIGTLYLASPNTAESIRLQLQEDVSGYYRVNLEGKINGTVQARLELEREGARLNRQLLLNL